MVALPVATPVTLPPASTVATAVLLLLQVPPLTASVRDTAAPIHTAEGPLMVPAEAVRLTVIAAVAVAVPQTVVEV